MKTYYSLEKTVVIMTEKDINKMECAGLGYGVDILLIPLTTKPNLYLMVLCETVRKRKIGTV